jgi:hypothetical protein
MPVEADIEKWPIAWIIFRHGKLEDLEVIRPGVDYYRLKP